MANDTTDKRAEGHDETVSERLGDPDTALTTKKQALGSELQISQVANGWRLRGELDAHTAPLLTQALTVLPPGPVTVGLAGVSFVDSSGLRVLLDASNRSRGAGGDLTLEEPQPSVERLIEISGLVDHFHVRS